MIDKVYTSDWMVYTPANGKAFECKVIDSTAANVTIKLTADDKDLSLVVGDKVKHGDYDMFITAANEEGTYGIGNDEGDDAALAFAGGILRAALTLIEGERIVEMNTLSTGDIFFKKLMDPDERVSLLPHVTLACDFAV